MTISLKDNAASGSSFSFDTTVGKIGEGRHVNAYLAQYSWTQGTKPVVVKIPKIATPEENQRIQRQADAPTGGESLPHVVAVIPVEKADGTTNDCIAVDYICGITLTQFINGNLKPKFEDTYVNVQSLHNRYRVRRDKIACQIVKGVAAAIKQMHDAGISHEELTADDVLITAEGSVALTGTGQAMPNGRTGDDLYRIGVVAYQLCVANCDLGQVDISNVASAQMQDFIRKALSHGFGDIDEVIAALGRLTTFDHGKVRKGLFGGNRKNVFTVGTSKYGIFVPKAPPQPSPTGEGRDGAAEAIKAEQEAARKAAEAKAAEARAKAEEARAKAEEERKAKLEAEEARAKAEAEARRIKAEQEAARKAAEAKAAEARAKAEEARAKAEEERKAKQEAEEARAKAEAEARRIKAEQETARKAAEAKAEEARAKAEAKSRKAKEEAERQAKLKAQQEIERIKKEAKRREEDIRRKAQKEREARLQAEAEAKKAKAQNNGGKGKSPVVKVFMGIAAAAAVLLLVAVVAMRPGSATPTGILSPSPIGEGRRGAAKTQTITTEIKEEKTTVPVSNPVKPQEPIPTGGTVNSGDNIPPANAAGSKETGKANAAASKNESKQGAKKQGHDKGKPTNTNKHKNKSKTATPQQPQEHEAQENGANDRKVIL